MISRIPILIFFAYATLDFSEGYIGFCDNGTETQWDCPCDSLVSGLQTAGELFSPYATPLCTKQPGQLCRIPAIFYLFYKKNTDDNRFNHFLPNKPKVECGPGHVIQALSICTERGDIAATTVYCRRLKDFSPANEYSVLGQPNSPVLKCKEGSVLSSLKYDCDQEDNLIAVATCIQRHPPSALQSCSVVQKTTHSLLVSCHKDLDGGHKASFDMEVYGPGSSLLYNLSSQTPDFSLAGLRPGTAYNVTVRTLNAAGESPPLTFSASTLASPKCRTEREGCEHGQLVKVACPDGYLVTGVETTSKIWSPDVTPLCSKIADKTIPQLQRTITRYYDTPHTLVQADCGESEPIVMRISMCFVYGAIKRTVTECGRSQDNGTIASYYSFKAGPDIKMLRCQEGSFFQGLKMERHEDGVRIRAKCVVVGETANDQHV